MTCHPISIAGGWGVICMRGQRASTKRCGACRIALATLECDWQLTGKKTGRTCDAPLCASCATEVGPDRHFCPAHQRLQERLASSPPSDPVASTHLSTGTLQLGLAGHGDGDAGSDAEDE